MKNTLKTLGILFLIAATFLIAACGPIEPVTPSYTVTFDADGGTPVPPIQTIEEDSGDLVKEPTKPTKTELTDAGFYKNFIEYTFDGWFDGNTKYEGFGKDTITADLKLKAKWSIPENVKIDLPAGAGDDVTKVFNYFDAGTTQAPTATDTYILYLKESANNPTAPLTLKKDYANLTIIGEKGNNGISINSPDLSSGLPTGNANKDKVFITVGTGAVQNGTTIPAPNTTKITLTLKNVAIKGTGKETSNSLIRVVNGATLTLDEKAYITGHVNKYVSTPNRAGDSYGDFGNGSAICIVNGSTLNIKQGAIVEKNKSAGTQTNTNLVGGIYVIGSPATSPGNNKNISTVNIEGGTIEKNECEDGNTADLYITELVKLNMKGYVTIGELCINSDDGNFPEFIVDGKIYNPINKLNLRSSTGNSQAAAALTTVKNVWAPATGRPTIFKGTSGYAITDPDVGQFTLMEFTGSTSLRPTKQGATYNKDDKTTWGNLIEDTYKLELANNEVKLANK